MTPSAGQSKAIVPPRFLVMVFFIGRHRGTTAEAHEVIARAAALVVRHYGGEVDPEGVH